MACPLCLNQRGDSSPETSQAGLLLPVLLKDGGKTLCDLAESQDREEHCNLCSKCERRLKEKSKDDLRTGKYTPGGL